MYNYDDQHDDEIQNSGFPPWIIITFISLTGFQHIESSDLERLSIVEIPPVPRQARGKSYPVWPT